MRATGVIFLLLAIAVKANPTVNIAEFARSGGDGAKKLFEKCEENDAGHCCIKKEHDIKKMEKSIQKDCWHDEVKVCYDKTVTKYEPAMELVRLANANKLNGNFFKTSILLWLHSTFLIQRFAKKYSGRIARLCLRIKLQLTQLKVAINI